MDSGDPHPWEFTSRAVGGCFQRVADAIASYLLDHKGVIESTSFWTYIYNKVATSIRSTENVGTQVVWLVFDWLDFPQGIRDKLTPLGDARDFVALRENAHPVFCNRYAPLSELPPPVSLTCPLPAPAVAPAAAPTEKPALKKRKRSPPDPALETAKKAARLEVKYVKEAYEALFKDMVALNGSFLSAWSTRMSGLEVRARQALGELQSEAKRMRVERRTCASDDSEEE